jgi:hypothetical protein
MKGYGEEEEGAKKVEKENKKVEGVEEKRSLPPLPI